MQVGEKSKLTLCVHLGCPHIITSQLSLCSSPGFVWTGTQVFLASLQPGIRGKTAFSRAFASVLPALAESAQLDWLSCRCGRNDICARCTIASPFVPPLPQLSTGVTNCTCLHVPAGNPFVFQTGSLFCQQKPINQNQNLNFYIYNQYGWPVLPVWQLTISNKSIKHTNLALLFPTELYLEDKTLLTHWSFLLAQNPPEPSRTLTWIPHQNMHTHAHKHPPASESRLIYLYGIFLDL